MMRMDLINYLLLEDPNADVKKMLGGINIKEEILGIEKTGENTIDVWSKPRGEEKNKDGAIETVYTRVLVETHNVRTIDTKTGKIVASRKVEKKVDRKPTPRLF